MRLQMIQSGTNRDSLVTPADRRTFDLMLQLRLQLVRCEPTSHFNVSGTHCNGISASAGRPWISQLRQHHLRPAHGEAPLTFTARVVGPQLITYWDNDWVPPAAAAVHAAP
jgi:hypothetical protein